MATIKIYSGNTSTGILSLSDGGHTWERKGGSINWKIKHEANVSSIEKIALKPKSLNIFSELPRMSGGNWKAKIADDASNFAESKYFIVWKDQDNNEHTHDPKISVKPSLTSLLLPILAVVGIVTLGLCVSKSIKR